MDQKHDVYAIMCWKTAGLLYLNKDDYGKAMSWLHVMLGTWHLLKENLGVFLKRYRGHLSVSDDSDSNSNSDSDFPNSKSSFS